MPHEWTAEHKEMVRTLVAEAKSATEVARLMPFPCTRNMIIGMVRRAKLGPFITKDGNEYPKTEKPKKIRVAKPRPVKAVKAPEVVKPKEAGPLNITLMELTERTCKWPTEGEREHQLFCGHEHKLGVSYCAAHAALMYYPKQPRVR